MVGKEIEVRAVGVVTSLLQGPARGDGKPASQADVLSRIRACGPMIEEFQAKYCQLEKQYEEARDRTAARLESSTRAREALVQALQDLEGLAAEEEAEGEGAGDKEADEELLRLLNEREYLLALRDVLHAADTADAHSQAGEVPEALMCLERLAGLRSSDPMSERDRALLERGQEAVLRLRGLLKERVETRLTEAGWPPVSDGQVTDLGPASAELGLLVRLQGLWQGAFQGRLGEGVRSEGLWAVDELSRPVLERFTFHFEQPDRPSNTADRPEWAYLFLLRALRQAVPAVSAVLEPAMQQHMAGIAPQAAALFFIRDVVMAARRKTRALLEVALAQGGEGADADEALEVVVDQALELDRALDQSLGYHQWSRVCLPGVHWPRCAEVLWATPARLERWADADARRVRARLKEACAGPDAWVKAPGETASAGASASTSATSAALAMAGLFQAVTERYRPVLDVPALRTLVERVHKRLVVDFAFAVYHAARACGVHQAALQSGPAFATTFRTYCHILDSARYVLEALDDAANDVTFVRVEAGEAPPTPGGALGLGAGHGGSVAKALLEAGQDTVKTAISSLSNTTESLTRAVGDSNTIIGPARVLSTVVGSLRDAVGAGTRKGPPTTASPSSRPPAQPKAGGGDGGDKGGALSPGKEAEAEAERYHLESVFDDLKAKDAPSAYLFASEARKLRDMADAMLEDAIDAIKAAFHEKAGPYLSHLPSALTAPTMPAEAERALGPDPRLLEGLEFLEAALGEAAGGLERQWLLRLWQGTALMAGQAVLQAVRKCRRATEATGRQLAADVRALVGVFAVGGHQRPENYFRQLRETVELLVAPMHALENLAELISSLSADATEGDMVGDGESPAAMQIRSALEARGVQSLGPEEALAVIAMRLAGRTPRGAKA
jgi:hypothetical protein